MPELFAIGNFKNPYGKSKRAEAAKNAAVNSDQWEPDSEDFDLVAGQSGAGTGKHRTIVSNDIFGLLRQIVDRSQRRSVSRLHVITHGNPNFVALAGNILVPKGGSGHPIIDLLKGLDEASLRQACERTIPGKKTTIFISTVRARFTESAKIILYACHSASARAGPQPPPSAELLHQVAALFAVEVLGFNENIAFCPNLARHEIRLGLGTCSKATGVRDIRQLVGAAGAALVRAPKPSPSELPECTEEPKPTGVPRSRHR